MSVDICISFDTTGSIYPALSEIRRKVTQFIDQLFNDVPNLRISLIAHGDYQDRYDPIVVPLTNDKQKLISFVKSVGETNGFGNGGEAYEWVMNLANDLDWQAEKKVFILIGDEPAHEFGKHIHTNKYDYKYTVRHDWREEQKHLLAKGVTTYTVRCLNRSDSIKFHNELARMNNVPLLTLAQFSNISELLMAVTYHQVSNERVEEYAEELQSRGMFNRNLADIFNKLTGKKSATRTFAVRNDGLVPVEPSRFQMLSVDEEIPIMDFVELSGARFRKGKGFYELTKREEVQEQKEVVLVEKNTGDMFSGEEARNLLGLPYGERGRVGKDNIPDGYTVFIQSTSSNRKLMPNTKFLYEVDYL